MARRERDNVKFAGNLAAARKSLARSVGIASGQAAVVILSLIEIAALSAGVTPSVKHFCALLATSVAVSLYAAAFILFLRLLRGYNIIRTCRSLWAFRRVSSKASAAVLALLILESRTASGFLPYALIIIASSAAASALAALTALVVLRRVRYIESSLTKLLSKRACAKVKIFTVSEGGEDELRGEFSGWFSRGWAGSLLLALASTAVHVWVDNCGMCRYAQVTLPDGAASEFYTVALLAMLACYVTVLIVCALAWTQPKSSIKFALALILLINALYELSLFSASFLFGFALADVGALLCKISYATAVFAGSWSLAALLLCLAIVYATCVDEDHE